ncbi:flagellar export chaperone FlgN [Legionella nagasakiensis]|uniref:flagellar export chaperone FlgN n=1 Tax=Legionella nagasakiensis TaxID=535290 RepID=UPI001056CF2A|nr:flagellar export chaperone FlgN [Legionella nagasakiensis]
MTHETLLSILNEFIHNIRKMSDLLRKDQEYFTQNRLDLLEENAIHKIATTQRLNELMHALDRIPDLSADKGDVFGRITDFAKRHKKQEITAALSTLQQEFSQCNELMTVNHNIINNNLSYLKDILASLTQHKIHADPVYDRSGQLAKE